MNGRGPDGCPLDPFNATDEPAVRVFAFTSCDSKNYDCLQPPVPLGKFSHSCCVDSQTSVTRQASRQRKEPLLKEIDVNACEVRPPAVHDCHGRRSHKKTHRCRSSVAKKHRRCSRRKNSINIAQCGVQSSVVRLVVVVKGSGVDDWFCMKLGVQVYYTGTRIHWAWVPIKLFLYESQGGGGGGGPSKFFGNTDLKKLRKLRTTPYGLSKSKKKKQVKSSLNFERS